MKKITQDATDKFLEAKPFKRDNTEVVVLPNVTILKLFGNEIAYLYNDPDRTLSIRNCGWFSNTTKERLNALPKVTISQKKGEWYLNGQHWNGNLKDIKLNKEYK
jgi:hypothetical protein